MSVKFLSKLSDTEIFDLVNECLESTVIERKKVQRLNYCYFVCVDDYVIHLEDFYCSSFIDREYWLYLLFKKFKKKYALAYFKWLDGCMTYGYQVSK